MIYADQKPEDNNYNHFVATTFSPPIDPIWAVPIGNIVWKFISVNTTNIKTTDMQKIHILTNPISISNYDIAEDLYDITTFIS